MGKYAVLGIGAALTLLNTGIWVANWSIAARAEVAGMGYYELKRDRDFKRAVVSIVEDCRTDGEGIRC